MTYEKSCGAVVFTWVGGEIRYVLAHSVKGHYGFPKGHVEAGETETQTALREIFEEVGLKPVLLDGFRAVSEYYIPAIDVHKQVVFFLGEYQNQDIVFQKEELQGAVLLPYEQAMQLLNHEDNRRILTQAQEFLSSAG